MKLLNIILLICLFLISCEKNAVDNNSFTKEMSVTALLSEFQQNQKVSVYYTTDKLNEHVQRDSLFIKNAIVEIRNSQHTVAFSYTLDSRRAPLYSDLSEPLQIIGGETYHLTVKSDAGEIRGQTTAPRPFRITEPSRGETVPLREMRPLTWQRKEGAAMYIINIKHPSEEIFLTPDSSVFIDHTSAYHTLDNHYTVPDNVLRLPGKHFLQVMACDENFKRHYMDKGIASGIYGGYGLFGSAMVDTLHFWVEE